MVREAARLLEDRGLVDIRPGRGMTVAAPGIETIVQRYRSVLRRDGASFSDLMQLRQMIEVDMSALAALNRTEADVGRMRETLLQARDHLDDYEACLAADLAFHMAVAQATQNPFVLTFAQPINMVLRDVYSKPIGYLATQENTLREHGAIADAIAAARPSGAVREPPRHTFPHPRRRRRAGRLMASHPTSPDAAAASVSAAVGAADAARAAVAAAPYG